jgi:hypothetical protein
MSRARGTVPMKVKLELCSSLGRGAHSTAPASDTNQPLASKDPVANSQTPYYYQFTFLSPGTYTVAFTCQAALDNPDQADTAVTFNPVKTGITVSANQTTTVDIP